MSVVILCSVNSAYSLHILQLTPIERYAMNFLEASLEDVCKEELKQAEVTPDLRLLITKMCLITTAF